MKTFLFLIFLSKLKASKASSVFISFGCVLLYKKIIHIDLYSERLNNTGWRILLHGEFSNTNPIWNHAIVCDNGLRVDQQCNTALPSAIRIFVSVGLVVVILRADNKVTVVFISQCKKYANILKF